MVICVAQWHAATPSSSRRPAPSRPTLPSGAEPHDARREKLLAFMDAKAAAERMVLRSDVRLKYFVDIRARRATATPGRQ